MMDIKRILEDVAAGKTATDEAFALLRDLPFADFKVAKHDAHRPLRNGFSEVILCEGKKIDHLVKIVKEMVENGANVFGTRADEGAAEAIRAVCGKVDYDPTSRSFRSINRPIEVLPGMISVLSAGTADIPVAEEAARTAEFFGVEVSRHYDVGVAGLHRLLSSIDSIRLSNAAIVVAGMEGALPSVLGGMVSMPIVAVPTSVGYGANFGGIAALLSMLNSCSEGVSVVNIDNGFGAACAALRIIREVHKRGNHTG